MSKLIKIVVFGAVLYVVYVGFLRPDWYELTDPDGGFVAHFPAEPRRQQERVIASPDGPAVRLNMYQYRNDATTFMAGSVHVAGLTRSDRSPKEITKQVAESIASNLGATVVGRDPVIQNGHPGLETRMTMQNRWSFDTRTFVVGNRIYVVGAGSSVMRKFISGRSRFFKAFEFLEPAPGTD